MNKKELIAATVEVLKENNIRKPIVIKPETFRVTQIESGSDATFEVAREDKKMLYTTADVKNILDAMLCLVEDAVRRGETVSIRNFGVLDVRYISGRMLREPKADIWHEIPGGYRPKFRPGRNLLAAARVYGLQREDDNPDNYLPKPEYDDFDDENEEL